MVFRVQGFRVFMNHGRRIHESSQANFISSYLLALLSFLRGFRVLFYEIDLGFCFMKLIMEFHFRLRGLGFSCIMAEEFMNLGRRISASWELENHRARGRTPER